MNYKWSFDNALSIDRGTPRGRARVIIYGLWVLRSYQLDSRQYP